MNTPVPSSPALRRIAADSDVYGLELTGIPGALIASWWTAAGEGLRDAVLLTRAVDAAELRRIMRRYWSWRRKTDKRYVHAAAASCGYEDARDGVYGWWRPVIVIENKQELDK